MPDINKPLAQLSIPAEAQALGPALDFFESMLKIIGFDKKDTLRMRLALEEASLNVIEHAFDPDEKGELDIVLERRPNQVVLLVLDKGLPVDFRQVEQGKSEGMGLKLIRGMTDEVTFLNLGKNGKCVELIKNIPYKIISDTLTEQEKKELKEMDKTRLESADIELRFMTPDDATAMARCVYRSYGYSYALDSIYYPDKIRENLESGIVKSVISIDKNTKEIVGHLALAYPSIGAKVADSGQAVVDPRYRGHNLFKRMKSFMVEYAQQVGLYGVYSEAVTVHPYTQKGNLSIGAYETGFLLCFIPDSMNFKKIQDEGAVPFRQSVVFFYLRTNPEPNRIVYIPHRHQTIIDKIYKRNNFNRTYGVASGKLIIPEITEANLKIIESIQMSYICVINYGYDFSAMLKHRLAELIEKKIEINFLDLPMSHPDTATMYKEAEKLGFFFVGIIPEIDEQGDYVRFLYLNGVKVEPEKYCLVSDFVQELFDYIIKERERVS